MIEFGDKYKNKSTSGHVITVRLRLRVKTIEIIFFPQANILIIFRI